jgi:lipopolysaccharide cholinephosphotransferase
MAGVDLAGMAALQVQVRRLLEEFDRLATEAGLPYFLAYGTALGAVRDGELIAWDPDADVWLPREHYARLVHEIGPRVSGDLELVAPETHPGYEYLFPRLTVRGADHVLLSLDIFPLDPAPAGRWARVAYSRTARLIAQVVFVKRADTSVRAHYTPQKRLLTRLLRALAAPVSARLLVALFRRLQGLNAGRGSGVLVNSCGAYGSREFFEEAWFADAVRRPLGEHSYPVPAGFDELLTRLYGDYRTPVSGDRRQRELEHATATFVRPLQGPGGLLHRAHERGRP